MGPVSGKKKVFKKKRKNNGGGGQVRGKYLKEGDERSKKRRSGDYFKEVIEQTDGRCPIRHLGRKRRGCSIRMLSRESLVGENYSLGSWRELRKFRVQKNCGIWVGTAKWFRKAKKTGALEGFNRKKLVKVIDD